jgi:hypothetical protein
MHEWKDALAFSMWVVVLGTLLMVNLLDWAFEHGPHLVYAAASQP